MIEVSKNGLIPIGYKIYIELDKKISEVGGIFIPDQYQVHGWNATVIRVGNLVNNGLKSGDEILIMKNYTTVLNRMKDFAITDSRFVMAKTILEKNKYYIQPINNFVLVKPDDVVKKIDNIHLSDKSIKYAGRGKVLRTGDKTKDIIDNKHNDNIYVYYESQLAIKCKEGNTELNLVSEFDIEMVTYE